MVTLLDGYLAFLLLLAGERLLELTVSRRHARALLARGGVEAGRGHYRPMVLLHAGFLAACAAEALARRAPPSAWALLALAGALLAQVLRWWAIATLGARWTTRVIVLPGAPPITGGPYRWVKHPNYLAVALELACVPLAYGGWRTALLFSLANAALLTIRIRAEERALGAGWERAFRGRSRFVPSWSARGDTGVRAGGAGGGRIRGAGGCPPAKPVGGPSRPGRSYDQT